MLSWYTRLSLKSLSDDSVELANGLVRQQLVEQYLEIRGGDHGQVLGEHINTEEAVVTQQAKHDDGVLQRLDRRREGDEHALLLKVKAYHPYKELHSAGIDQPGRD